MASCLAGTCNVLLTNPLWLTNMRIVTGETKNTNLFRALSEIMAKDGLWSMWSGTGSSILLISNPVLQFFAYERLKSHQLDRADRANLAPLQAFVTGAIAKAIATIVTYPLQLTQTVLRLQRRPPAEHEQEQIQQYRGIWDCLWKLYQKDGLPGWFMGMRAKLLQSVMTAAFTFLTYEQILGAVHAAHQSLLARRKILEV